jgi:hypothetical protein
MTPNAISHLSPAQRYFLSELTKGAQGICRYASFEAYSEEGGQVRCTGATLSPEQMAQLVEAVPELEYQPVANARDDDGGEVGGFLWLPSASRGRYADLLTMSMATESVRMAWRSEIRDDEHLAHLRERAAV